MNKKRVQDEIEFNKETLSKILREDNAKETLKHCGIKKPTENQK